MSSKSDSDDGGRFGRTPYKPQDLIDEYGVTDSGLLDVTCPGCEKQYYPASKCCVDRYAGDPFCPECGTDFRVETITFQPKVKFWSVEELTNRKGNADDVTDEVKEAMELLDDADDENAARALTILQKTFGTLEPEARCRGDE